jgi:hypothetical protein
VYVCVFAYITNYKAGVGFQEILQSQNKRGSADAKL